MQLRHRVEEAERRAAGARMHPVDDAAIERDERAARGDVPGEAEKSRPARDRQRARAEARRMRLANFGRRALFHGARNSATAWALRRRMAHVAVARDRDAI